MGANGLKVQMAVSELQRALHDPSRGIRVLSSEMISHFLKLYILFNHKCSPCTSSAMCVRNFMHCVITLEKSHMVSPLSVYSGSKR